MPPHAPAEMSDALAERYVEMADLLRTVPLDELDRKIERLLKLRDAVARVQGVAPAPAPPDPDPDPDPDPEPEPPPALALPPANGPAIPAPRATTHPHKRRPDGYWLPVAVRVLRESDAPMQLRSILERAVELGLADERDGSPVISHTLQANPDRFEKLRHGVWKLRDNYREKLDREQEPQP